MFLTKSKEWRGKFESSNLAKDQHDVISVLSQGGLMVRDLKTELNRQKISTLQENDIRKTQHVAKERLRSFLKTVHPFTREAYTRVDNFSVSLGTRDRFKQIRNELNPHTSKHNKTSLVAYTQWADKVPLGPDPHQTPDWRHIAFSQTHDDYKEEKRKSVKHENKGMETDKNQSGQ